MVHPIKRIADAPITLQARFPSVKRSPVSARREYSRRPTIAITRDKNNSLLLAIDLLSKMQTKSGKAKDNTKDSGILDEKYPQIAKGEKISPASCPVIVTVY